MPSAPRLDWGAAVDGQDLPLPPPAQACRRLRRDPPAYPRSFRPDRRPRQQPRRRGARAARSLETHTLIASPDVLLADWVGAAKMGLDPFASPVNAKAMRVVGLPSAYEVDGDLAPYEGWRNVHPVLADSVRRRNEWVRVARVAEAWLQQTNQDLFPFKDALDGRINALLSRWFACVDDNPAGFWATVVLNYSLAAVHEGAVSLATLFAKEQLRRREVPLDLDLAAYTLADYEAITGELGVLAELIRQSPADRNGLRSARSRRLRLIRVRPCVPGGIRPVRRLCRYRCVHASDERLHRRSVRARGP